jgi:hypothetical protein
MSDAPRKAKTSSAAHEQGVSRVHIAAAIGTALGAMCAAHATDDAQGRPRLDTGSIVVVTGECERDEHDTAIIFWTIEFRDPPG